VVPQPRPAETWTARDAESWLLGLEQFGMRFGLDRMRRLMTALGNPHERFRAIHVVGTNGKSSTVRMTYTRSASAPGIGTVRGVEPVASASLS